MKHLLAVSTLVAVALSGCNDAQYKSQMEAVRRAENRESYIPETSLDFLNYDRRQRISDDPSTIVWCTMFPPSPGVRPITMPIVGKLTSGGKRPFASDPGPDGMYGSSGEYRYGFTPDGNMADFFGMATLCTTEPTVWQRNSTDIVLTIDPRLSAAGDSAKRHLSESDTAASRQSATAAITAAIQ